MPPPQLNEKTQTRERPTYEEMVWENLQETKTEVRETRRELNARMDRIERRMDKLEEELKATRLEVNARIEKLADKIDSFRDRANTNRRVLPNILIIDLWRIVVTIAVLYAILK